MITIPEGAREATITYGTNGENGRICKYVSDSGLSLLMTCLNWMNNAENISCIPPGPDDEEITFLVTFRWSQKHGKNLYHIEGVERRTNCEIHSANVPFQLLGCFAPGEQVATFKKDSIAPGMPPVDCQGVTSSLEALTALERDMRDKDGNQVPFYLTIKNQED